MKTFAFFVALLAVTASARQVAEDPKCKSELAAAQAKIASAEGALNKANAAFAADAKKYSALLSSDAATVKKAADAHNAVYDQLKGAVDAANVAKNNYLNLNNTLASLKAQCASPTPPTDCAGKLKKAQANLAAALTAEGAANTKVAHVKDQIASTQKTLDNDINTQNNDISKKQDALKLDQKDIDGAKQGVTSAQSAYNALVKKCSGPSGVLTLAKSESDPNCDKELADASAAIDQAKVDELHADEKHAGVDKQWIPILSTDAAAVKKAADDKNNAANQLAPASQKENDLLQKWQDAKAHKVQVTNQCAQPVKPDNCNELEGQAAKDESDSELAYNEARIAADDVVRDIEMYSDILNKVLATQERDFGMHKKALADAEQGVVAARLEAKDAQQKYNALVLKCKQQ